MAHELPKLPYAYDALEPSIDATTMELHHTKHHAGYVTKLNAALENYPDLQAKGLEELLRGIDGIPKEIKTAVRNHGGGHANHSLFWAVMAPSVRGGGDDPPDDMIEALGGAFGDIQKFKEEFGDTASGVFGSGWVWLVADGQGKLKIASTPNQDSPLMAGLTPVLGLDVWEHAYYLKYRNARQEYIAAWWNVVSWEEVAKRYRQARS